MKKIKLLLVMLAVTIVLLTLSGCEHSHDYMWVNGENPKSAFEICKACFHVRDMEKEYNRPLTVGMPDWGSMPTVDPPIGYDIELDSGMYNYNEEINITLNLYFGYPYYINFSEGDMHVKISESEYYEIVGKDEYIVEDFSSERAKEAEKLSYEFTIKATEACKGVESVEFKIKANLNGAFWNFTTGSIGDPAGWYCDKSWEYCFTIFSLGFKSDSQGIIFNEYDERLFYDSINREYLSGVLSKDDYIYKFYEYYLDDSVILDLNYVDDNANKPYFKYLSKNIRAEFYLTTSCEYFMSLYNDKEKPIESKKELKKRLIKTLFDEGYISSEEYEREINYIEEGRQGNGYWFFTSYDYIPIKSHYKENKINYVYVEERSVVNSNSLGYSEGNIASLYLSNDRIEVGGDVDVSICTEFSDTISDPFKKLLKKFHFAVTFWYFLVSYGTRGKIPPLPAHEAKFDRKHTFYEVALWMTEV